MILIGKIARPHGVRGMVAVNLEDPESRSLLGVSFVHLGRAEGGPEKRAVGRTAPGRKGQVLIHIAGVETPEAADLLREREVFLEESQLPELEDGEFWHRDLLTLVAVNREGRELGPIAEVVDTADIPVLLVRGTDGDLFVPFTEPYVLEIDLEGRRVVVEPPEMAEIR